MNEEKKSSSSSQKTGRSNSNIESIEATNVNSIFDHVSAWANETGTVLRTESNVSAQKEIGTHVSSLLSK